MNDAGTQTAVIEVMQLTHMFKAQRALSGVSFQVHDRSLHGFVGPNGAGKTTSLKIICTLLRPQHGHGARVRQRRRRGTASESAAASVSCPTTSACTGR